MLHVLIAALQLTWSGVGQTSRAATPAIVARPPGGRVPIRPVVLQAYEGRDQVVADYTVTPSGATVFTATDPLGFFSYATDSYALPGVYGPATIHARYRTDTASLPAFIYRSLAVSCYFTFADGAAIDSDGVAQTTGTPQESDIYQTGPPHNPATDIFRGCSGAFIDATHTTYPLHVPYGGTLIPSGSRVYFGDVSVSAWRNDFSVVPQLRAGDILLFKTKDGRVVKLLVYPSTGGSLSGAYIAGPPHGDFLDYLTWHTKRKHSR